MKTVRLTTISALIAVALSPLALWAQGVTYNPTSGALTVDTTGIAMFSIKVRGPQATSIDRWLDGTNQDSVDWTQVFFTNNATGETSENWVTIDANNQFPWPLSPVAEGTYQIATYATGFTQGDWDGFGLTEMSDLVDVAGPGQTWTGFVQVAGGGALCDFDGNGTCDTDDMRVLYDDISAGTLGGPTDLDGNGTVENDDIDDWLALAGTENGKDYRPGDADLDGNVGGGDFTELASNFGNIGLPGAYWDQGNFDGNNGGTFTVGGSDFTALAVSFGHVSVSAATVPEPGSMSLFLLASIGMLCFARKQ